MTHILHRAANAVMPVAVSAAGVEIFDAEGRRYLDASGGAAVSCLGHGHPDVVAALTGSSTRSPTPTPRFFTSEPAERLADRLVADAPQGVSHVYLVSGGSEAIEAALKMARQFFVETGEPQRRADRGAAAELSRQYPRRSGGGRKRVAARVVRAPADRDPSRRSMLRLPLSERPGERRRIRRARGAGGRGQARRTRPRDACIAFVAETVVGATAGAVPPVGDYFRRVRAICDRYGVLLILDEVMCGMGRTGALHACSQEGIAPDLMTIAKGLGGGYQPIGAVLLTRRIFDAFANGSGAFQHGHTYMGHPMAAAAALAVQEVDPPGRSARQRRRHGRACCDRGLVRAPRQAPARRRHSRPRALPRRWNLSPTGRPRRRSIRRRSFTRGSSARRWRAG